MKKYQYQIIRYMHDRVTSEFVNVGIVLYQPENKLFKCKTIKKYSRLSNFFGEVNGKFLLDNLRQFEKEVAKIDSQMNAAIGSLYPDGIDLELITSQILPKDDSALYCSELKEGMDINGDKALEYIYNRLVGRYSKETNTKFQSDEDIWRNIYKSYFDRYKITAALKPHAVKTENDTFEFERAWKNGVWHCFQTLNFNLKKDNIIKDKAYKWSAILDELDTTDEQVHIYLLTSLPKDENGEFVERKLSQEHKNLKVTLIKEKQAEILVEQMLKELEEHKAKDISSFTSDSL